MLTYISRIGEPITGIFVLQYISHGGSKSGHGIFDIFYQIRQWCSQISCYGEKTKYPVQYLWFTYSFLLFLNGLSLTSYLSTRTARAIIKINIDISS